VRRVRKSYVDDDAQFSDVLQLGAEQFPDGLLVVPLALVQRLVVAHHVRPAALEGEERRRVTRTQLVRVLVDVVVVVVGYRKAARRVPGQDVGQLLLLVRRRLQSHWQRCIANFAPGIPYTKDSSGRGARRRPRSTQRSPLTISQRGCCLSVTPPYGPLEEIMTSMTKPEVRNVSKRRRRRTEPRLQAICTENLAKFGRVVAEISVRTDGQTEGSSQHFAPYRGRSKQLLRIQYCSSFRSQ